MTEEDEEFGRIEMENKIKKDSKDLVNWTSLIERHYENGVLVKQTIQYTRDGEKVPYGWYIDGYGAVIGKDEPKSVRVGEWLPWYNNPPQRTWVGLTDEEYNDCLVEGDPCEALAEPEARAVMEAVEAKLKEKNT